MLRARNAHGKTYNHPLTKVFKKIKSKTRNFLKKGKSEPRFGLSPKDYAEIEDRKQKILARVTALKKK